jgi:hypothetical protein
VKISPLAILDRTNYTVLQKIAHHKVSMQLADLNPFIPKESKERALFIQTFSAEVRTYRKRPSFWLGLITALVCAFVLIYRLDTIGRLIMLPIVFGLATAHDTITSHFTRRLIEERRSGNNDALDPTEGEQAAS